MNMKQFNFFLFIIIVLISVNVSAQKDNEDLPSCEWCGADEAPSDISWKTTIPGKNEPGEPLIIYGQVVKSDKKTPAPDVIIYVYHTNYKGVYPKKGNETGNGKRHGYLRSWMRTNDEGKFQFTTIKPGSYPNSTEPAHIHLTIKYNDREEYPGTIFFTGDPLLTGRENESGNVLTLNKDKNGNWTAEKVIVLKD